MYYDSCDLNVNGLLVIPQIDNTSPGGAPGLMPEYVLGLVPGSGNLPLSLSECIF